MNNKHKCLVLGIGNRYRSDDAVGLEAIGALRKHLLAPDVEAVEVGTDELSLIEHLKNAPRAVIVDALSSGRPPGTVTVFSADQAGMISTRGTADMHSFGLADTLALARALGVNPLVTIVGIEPLSIEPGDSLTPLVASGLPDVVQAVLDAVCETRETKTCSE